MRSTERTSQSEGEPMLDTPLRVDIAQYPDYPGGARVRLTFRFAELLAAFEHGEAALRDPVLLLAPVIELLGPGIFDTRDLDAYNPDEWTLHLYGRLADISEWEERYLAPTLRALTTCDNFAGGVLFVPIARPTPEPRPTRSTAC